MASLARRIAPAAALGGLAVVIVGVLDPALATNTAATNTPIAATGQSETVPAAAVTCDNATAVTGPVVNTRWGPVQVAATVVDGTLCEAHAVVWPDGDQESVQINAYAIPQLDAMASQQGVAFDGVSGATYTTEGYRESLQQLLDSL